ncbi:MAG TPA: L-rhamnose mutarotase [Candidatus Handelsmanbacteria bacterium]|nr:L-rhamnose mutarotase [Candidatus Handelsmanbacteria bacterium]
MYSIGLAMTLRSGAYAEYKKAHDELWPEIAESMSDNDVSMAIYRFGENLVIHAVAPTEADWNKSRDVPILEKWFEYMSTLLATDQQGEIIFEDLPEAFAFGIFKAD